jgi:hypothetical protein
MGLRVWTITVACNDPSRMAAFWKALLEYERGTSHTSSELLEDPLGNGPRLLLQPSSLLKSQQNQLHLDLRPDDHDAAVALALDLGASPVDVGQAGSESWTVLADPEGNEFCILQSQASYNAMRQPRYSSP